MRISKRLWQAAAASGVALMLASSAAAQSPSAPQPSATPDPRAPVRAQGGPPALQYKIDLAVPAPTAPVGVPNGVQLDAWVANATLLGRYRLTVHETDPVIAREPEPRPMNPGYRKVDAPPRPCEAQAAAWNALFEVSREADVPAAGAAIERATGGTPCETLAKQVFLHGTRRFVNSPREVKAGTRLTLTIERLAAGDDTVTQSWTTTFVPLRTPANPRYPTEQAGLALWIASDLADLAAFTAREPAPAEGAVSVALVGDAVDTLTLTVARPKAPVSREIAVSPHVFAPALYVPLAQALLGPRAGRSAVAPGATAAILTPLADLRAPNLLQESRRVSARLTAEPRDVRAHEEAALLWGAFALRESKGGYSDTRQSIARMTAHLAFATALRSGGKPGRAAVWSEILLATLTGRAAEAVARLDALGPLQAAEASWAEALRVRNDFDWRKVPSLEGKPLVVQLEVVRARERVVGGLDAVHVLFKDVRPAQVPDWARILLPGGASVQEGNMFSASAIPLEIAELALAHGIEPVDLQDDMPRVASLLAPAPVPLVRRDGERASVEVLGPQAFSAAAARSVFAQAIARRAFLDGMLVAPEEAEAFRVAADPLVRASFLYPFVQASWGRAKDDVPVPPTPGAVDCAALRALLERNPMTVPPGEWIGAERPCRGTQGFPPAEAFFDPVVPTGTTLGAAARLYTGGLGLKLSTARLVEFRDLAPYDARLVHTAYMREHRGAVPEPIVLEKYAPLVEYQLSAARDALSVLKNEPAQLQVRKQACALSADWCVDFGWQLEPRDPAAAAAAYQRAVDEALDRVGVANRMDWLVLYYEQQGQADRALKVAQEAGEVASGSGLRTLSLALERRGRLDEAEKIQTYARRRYDDESGLLEFYMRAALRPEGKRFQAKAAEARQALFPGGLQPFTSGGAEPPTSGAVFQSPSVALRRAGILAGDVLVGLDGYRVDSRESYGNLKATSVAPTMKLTVWHDSKYVEIDETRDLVQYFYGEPYRPRGGPTR
jgi:tetratricopeptide (TPR) repeat protein